MNYDILLLILPWIFPAWIMFSDLLDNEKGRNQ